MKEKVAETLKTGSHGTTFGGNPLACAAANAVLDVILKDGFLEHVQEISAYLGEKLEDLARKFPEIVTEIRGTGLMRGLKLADNLVNTDIILKLRANKLICNAAGQNVVRLLPALIIEKKHVDEAIEKIDQTLRAL